MSDRWTDEDEGQRAEIESARGNERAVERQERRQRRRNIDIMGQYAVYPAKLVRDWVRSVLMIDVIERMYDIGMGIEKFDVPTEAGNIVTVPAFASVQVAALAKLIDIGVPRQLGLVDGGGDALPGVIALGALDLKAVQERAMAERFPPPAAGVEVAAGNGSEAGIRENGGAQLSPSVLAKQARGEMEVVEIEESALAPADGERPGELPPPPLDPKPTLAQQILARRRAAKNGGNGHP